MRVRPKVRAVLSLQWKRIGTGGHPLAAGLRPQPVR